MLGGHRLFEHAAFFGALGLLQLAFQLRDHAVGQLAGPAPIAAALRLLQFGAGLFELFLQLLRVGELALLGLPLGGQLGRFLLQILQFFHELLQAVLRGRVVLFLQGLALDLQLDDAAVELVDLLRLHQVDRLVRQEAVGDVAVRQGRRRDQRAVGDPDPVVHLVFFLDAAQDRDRVLDRRLGDEDRLKPPGQRRVLLDLLAVFVQGRGADAMQLTAR